MNISPTKFAALSREIDQIRTQLTSLFAMLAQKSRPRDPSIAGFCERKGISRSTYVNLRKAGKGPRETPAGARRIIITESVGPRAPGPGACAAPRAPGPGGGDREEAQDPDGCG
jgi:hypothetical protein